VEEVEVKITLAEGKITLAEAASEGIWAHLTEEWADHPGVLVVVEDSEVWDVVEASPLHSRIVGAFVEIEAVSEEDDRSVAGMVGHLGVVASGAIIMMDHLLVVDSVEEVVVLARPLALAVEEDPLPRFKDRILAESHLRNQSSAVIG